MLKLLSEMTGSPIADWLEKKYLEWQMVNGRASIRQFAKWLDMSHASVINLMNGKGKPGPKMLPKLAAKLGYEIYDMSGLPRPDPEEEELIHAYRAIPPNDQKALLDLIERFLLDHGFKRTK